MEFCSGDGVQISLAVLLSTVLFMLLIGYISMHPQKDTVPLKIIFIIMFIIGTVMYCLCHYYGIGQPGYKGWVKGNDSAWLKFFYVALRSVIDVGTMFYGRANTDVFYSLPAAQEPFYILMFWFIYTTIFYITASALLICFGHDLLRWIRIMLAKLLHYDIDIVFGINSDSIVFGRKIADRKHTMLIYVDSMACEDYESSIRDMGGIIYSNIEESPSFVHIKPGKTKLRLYAMSSDYDRNIEYARKMLVKLEQEKILPEQTELTLLGTNEDKGMDLFLFQADKKQYGYGNVISFDDYEMSARLLIREYPICNAVNFDESGRASENIDVLIGGFGHIGHEVLRKVIANGRFEGSILNVWIFDPKHGDRTGFIKSQYPKMFQPPYSEIEINFATKDIRSSECFTFLEEHAAKLKYIVICLEDREKARDIAIRMIDRLQAIGHPMNVYTCDHKSVRCYSHDTKECMTHWIYDSDLLYSGKMDEYAMELNHRYMELYRSGSENINAAEDWRNCDYFGRMSSRASVDYLIPLIQRVMANSGGLTPEQKENLSKSEHLRWCAFHYTFGYDVMEIPEFIQRVKDWQREINEQGKSYIKITKDTQNKTHVCLIEWDMLDEVSRAENDITHGTRDYKEYDRK